MSRQFRAHVVLTLLVATSRLALRAAGLQFYFTLDWMWMSDPADLRDRLLETMFYFHAFTPGMNFVTGVILKLGGSHPEWLALGFFWLLGLVLVNALFYLGRTAGLSTRAALTLALVFTLLPQTIYFEHLYLYETPVTTLLIVAACLFHGALTRSSSWIAWLAFFAVCATIGLTRTTFHLIWFIAMLGFALMCVDRQARRPVLAGALLPALVLTGLYTKNLLIFGEFAASTFGPSSLTHITISQLPPAIKAAWINEGRIAPVEALSPYAPPREYLALAEVKSARNWPAQMTRLEQPSVSAANFNHWLLLAHQSERRADALYYLRERPLDYLQTVLRGTRDMFSPSTTWHPRDGTDRSPHYQHRQILGWYESFFNRIVHRLPAPVGLYALLPLVCLWTLVQAWTLRTSDRQDVRLRGALLAFCLFQICYVVAFTNVITFLESSRYRYQVEPFILLLSALAIASVGQRTTRRRSS